MRHRLLTIAAFLGVVLGSSAFALATGGSGQPSGNAGTHGSAVTQEAGDQAQAGEHGSEESSEAVGGAIDRFHQAGGCTLVDVSGLSGNWTHGSYVSAVAALGDPSVISTAAHSECGKPMVAVEHGNGPPEQALQHIGVGEPSGS